jgi:hypothetical protein
VFTQEEAHHRLTQFIVQSGVPLSLVDSKCFRNFISYIHPHYTLPSHCTLCAHLLGDQQAGIKAKMEKIRLIQHFSICLDSWTSVANVVYLAIMGKVLHLCFSNITNITQHMA